MTYDQIFAHPMFASFFNKYMEVIEKYRLDLLKTKDSKIKFKRTVYDRFKNHEEGNKLTSEWFIEKYMLILQHKSNLPALEREFISHVVNDCIHKVILYNEKKEKENGTDSKN